VQKSKIVSDQPVDNDPIPSDDLAPHLAGRLSFLVHTISARIAILGNKHFREHDINHFSARILVFLLERKELRVGELVELMLLPQSTISSLLNVLRKRRLIRRRRDPKDNRSVIVSLTSAGVQLAGDCDGLSARVQELMLRDISAKDKQVAYGFLHSINERLRELELQEVYPFHSPSQLAELMDQKKTKLE